MTLTPDVAQQVADLLNAQNRLGQVFSAADILDGDRHIVHLDDSGNLLGVIEVRKVQWYQCEIDHLSVDPEAKHVGLGTSLMEEAEDRARQLGASIAQCTVRVGNVASEGLVEKCGYRPTLTFFNVLSGNHVTVYQKLL